MTFQPFPLNSAYRVHALTTDVALAPVVNALNSFALLNTVATVPEGDAWLRQTAMALSPEARDNNRLLLEGFGAALLIGDPTMSFEAYLEQLDQIAPSTLCALLAERLSDDNIAPTSAHDGELQPALQTLLAEPSALHDLLVSHLRMLWETALRGEWQRKLELLDRAVEGMQHYVVVAATPAETIRAFLGRDLPSEQTPDLVGVQAVIFVPSPHAGMHTTTWRSGTSLYVCFGLHTMGVFVWRTSPVGRRELLVRLTALADDTRLQILRLFTEHAELGAQEIMTALGLSQSSASRHLSQLSSAGFLLGRRSQGANKLYHLAPHHIQNTFRALERLLTEPTEPATPTVETEAVAPELRYVTDGAGRITRWPSKQRERQAVLGYLAGRFEPGRRYTEREVNTVLSEWHTFHDPVTLRRELIDAGLINRERNGSSYWLPE